MKNVLCNKDGKFLSVHEKNETFVEFKDGDYLTHEDGCILIYKEYECKENIRWRAKKGYMYYYIDFNGPDSFCVASRTETFDYIDECKFNTHNYFQTEKEAEKKLDSIKKHPQ